MDAEVVANRYRFSSPPGDRPLHSRFRPHLMSHSLVWGLIGQWAIEFFTFFIELWSPNYIREWAKWLRSMRLTCRVANHWQQPWPNLLHLCYCYWRPLLRGRGHPIRPWSHFWRPHPWFEICDWPTRYRKQLDLWSFHPRHSCFDGLLHPLTFLLRPNVRHPEYQDFRFAHERRYSSSLFSYDFPSSPAFACEVLDSDSDHEVEDSQFGWCLNCQVEDLRKQIHHRTFEFPYPQVVVNDLM